MTTELTAREAPARYVVEVQPAIPKGYKQTEVGVIPEDWVLTTIISLIAKNTRITYGVVQPGRNDPSGVLFVRGGDVFDGEINIEGLRRISAEVSQQYERTLLRGGELVISLVGFPGECAIVPHSLAGANIARQVALVRLLENEQSSPAFVCHYLRSAHGKRLLLKEAFGSAQQVINLKDINKLEFPLPSTKAEQEAIAEALSDADALIESLEQLVAKKRHLKQGAMQELLTGKRRLPGFGGEWEVKQLGEVAAPRNERIDPRKSGVQEFCIELEHIGSATGSLLGSTSTGEQSSLKSVFRTGDVLFGKLRAYLRKYWYADRPGVCSTEIWVLSPRDNLISSTYLFQIVQTDKFIDVASSAYGTHMPRSDWNVVKNFEFPLPPTTEEQTAIATILSDMDAEIAALEARLAKARGIKQGMMQELLTGKIRLV